MTQEDKDLLLKDLCSRLPYGVKIDNMGDPSLLVSINKKYKIIVEIAEVDKNSSFNSPKLDVLEIEDAKPYLFPLSSMTEEQKKEYNRWKHEVPVCHYEYGDVVEEVELFDSPESFMYLIENHFDYHGLIPKGLANDATGLNLY